MEARGREEEDASLGNPEPPLRALPFGAPEARFLCDKPPVTVRFDCQRKKKKRDK